MSAGTGDEAGYVRSFLAHVRPLDGCCYCGDDRYHAGRAAIEQIALAFEYDEQYPMPTAERCVDVLNFLTCIEALDNCYGCAGTETQCGLNIVLHVVADRLAETIESCPGAVMSAVTELRPHDPEAAAPMEIIDDSASLIDQAIGIADLLTAVETDDLAEKTIHQVGYALLEILERVRDRLAEAGKKA